MSLDMVKFSHAANLAIHALSYMAKEPETYFSANQLGKKMGASATHLSKVLNRLAASGLVKSVRGSRGGFALATDAEKISLLTIVESIDGKLEYIACFLDRPICRKKSCVFTDLQKEFVSRMKEELSGITLLAFVTQTGF